MKQTNNKYMIKYWENMKLNKLYIKGVNDSMTENRVLATMRENYFNPDDCYFAYVNDLPFGTCYVDAE